MILASDPATSTSLGLSPWTAGILPPSGRRPGHAWAWNNTIRAKAAQYAMSSLACGIGINALSIGARTIHAESIAFAFQHTPSAPIFQVSAPRRTDWTETILSETIAKERRMMPVKPINPFWLSREEPRSPTYIPAPMVFEPPEPQHWAYHVVRIDPREDEPLDEALLNALGAEGWLLAGVLEPQTGRPHLYYYFVRAAS
jgi:hypothetical protein